MKKRKTAWILTFSGVLLLLSMIILGKALVVELSRLNGNYSMQKLVVSVNNQLDPKGIHSFSIEDIRKLEKELATKDISYTAQSGHINTSVSNGSTTLPVRLTGVDHMYPLFSGLTLQEGSFITEKQEEEGAMVAVIDEELAWNLFKTVNATGKTLEIFGGDFRIIGVVKKDDTLIGKLTDDGLPDVYIPAAVMLELNATARITALQIRTADAGTLGWNTFNVSTALRQIGKDPANYNITDYNLRYALIKQWPLLFVFILGFASILTLLAHVKMMLRKVYSLIWDGCKTDYLANVIKNNLAGIGTCTLKMALGLTGIVLIWLGIRFRLYIPPQNIPDELINFSYYSDLIKSAIQGGIQNMGYVAPRPELMANTVNMLLNLLFFVSVVLGFLLLYAGLRELKALNVDTNKLTLVFGILFVLSLAILAAVAFWAGLSFIPEAKSILVAWAFLFLTITKGKESDVNNV